MGGSSAALAAFHLFYGELTRTLPTGETTSPPLHGPARDAYGEPLKLSPEVARKMARAAIAGDAIPQLIPDFWIAPGRYRLVPVDKKARRVQAVAPFEFVVAIDPTSEGTLRSIAEQLAIRLTARIGAHPRIDDPDVRDTATLLSCHLQEHIGEYIGALVAAPPGNGRDALIERVLDEGAARFEHAISGEYLFDGVPTPLTGDAVRMLAREPLECTVDAIRTACKRLRYTDAVARIFARAVLNVPTPADELLPLLAGIGTPYLIRALFAVATGDRAIVAIRSVSARGIPSDTADASARALALFLAWRYRENDGIRDQLVRLARTVARAPLGAEGGGLMHALAAELGDLDLRAVVTASALPARGETNAAQQLDMPIERILRDLDTRAFETRVTPLWPPDLAELATAPTPSTPESLLDGTRRFSEARLWEQATAYATTAAAFGQPCADRYYAVIAEYAARAGNFGIAAALLPQIRDRMLVPRGIQLGVSLALPEDSALRDAVHSLYQGTIDEPLRAEAVARALLASVPPLGLLVARGCVPSAGDRAESLLDAIEHARDTLGLPPFDSAWKQHEHTRELADFRNSVAAQLASLSTERDAARERLTAAERNASTDRGEAERARIELRAERDHVEMLEAIIRERNEERAELRRERDELRLQLAALDATTDTAPDVEAVADSHDSDDDSDPVTATVRRALGCETSRDVREALSEVPPHVAAEAMRTLGQLAAGDAAAWRAVKQAKGTDSPIYQARIGIHHRLIFRTDEQTLHAIDLVTRASLLAVLRRVRTARREGTR